MWQMIQNMGWQMIEWQMKHNLYIKVENEGEPILQTNTLQILGEISIFGKTMVRN